MNPYNFIHLKYLLMYHESYIYNIRHIEYEVYLI